jgi:hypothetical protein
MSILEKLKISRGQWDSGVSQIDGFDYISVSLAEDHSCVTALCGHAGEVDEEESIANANLISQAPAMLEALIEHMYTFEENNMTPDLVETRKIIESATNKTWEEIKELL